jgi:hypothetical protein
MDFYEYIRKMLMNHGLRKMKVGFFMIYLFIFTYQPGKKRWLRKVISSSQTDLLYFLDMCAKYKVLWPSIYYICA